MADVQVPMVPNSAYWERFEDPLHLKSFVMTVDAEVLFCLSMFHKATEESAWRRVFGKSDISSAAQTLILAFFSCAKRPLSHVIAPQKWLTGEMPAIVTTNCPQWQWIKPIYKLAVFHDRSIPGTFPANQIYMYTGRASPLLLAGNIVVSLTHSHRVVLRHEICSRSWPFKRTDVLPWR